MSERPTCAITGCIQDPGAKRGLCRGHWKRLPDDMQERVRWALTHGTREDREAAMLAAAEYLEE